MTIASRFLSVNSEDVLVEDKRKEDKKSSDIVTDPDRSGAAHLMGRPGQLSVKIRQVSSLPLASGPVHRFAELEYSGTLLLCKLCSICYCFVLSGGESPCH